MILKFKSKIILGLIILIVFILSIIIFLDKGKKSELKFKNATNSLSQESNSLDNKNKDNKAIQPSVKDNEEISHPTAATEKSKYSSNNSSNGIKAKTSTDVSNVTSVTTKAPKIINKLVNWGFTKEESRAIDTIIIHSSYNVLGNNTHDVEDIINKEYKPAGVSPHYIIARDGTIYRLVQDKNIAYHAGVSKMPDGRTNVNNFSLGIEIVETTSESPSDKQYTALKNLIMYLKGKYKIKYVLGHSDIAPGRKTDPWNFNWKRIK